MIRFATEGSDELANLPLLADGAADFGFPLSSAQMQRFALYSELLLEWNQRVNLTAITDLTEIQIRHFLDSLTCAVATGNLNGQYLIDIGTGAGFPGLPLKLLYEDLNLTLVESAAKKVQFIQAVVSALGLEGVQVVAERVEILGQLPAFRARYDWAVARGLAKMPVLVEYLLPLCRIGGKMLAQKGAGAEEETKAAAEAMHTLGGDRPQLFEVKLPGRQQTHFLVVVEKISDTPSNFPRRVGVPSKRPLKSTNDIEQRIEKAAQNILENEQLTADMDDLAADQLLDWALAWTELVARATEGLDDSAAAEVMSQKLRSVRRLLRTINRWFRDQQRLTEEERSALLEKVIEQATVIHDPHYVPPSSDQRAAFVLESLDMNLDPEEMIVQFRELVEGSDEMPVGETRGSGDKESQK